jgi:hypothetical protein
MALSDEDMRRIEEEEYRKLARERLERTVRLEADIRTSGDQRLEVRGVSTEIYRDAKGVAGFAGWTFLYVLFTHWRLCIASVLLVWLLISSFRK